MLINLVQNGIFPIKKDKNGELLEGNLDTGFTFSGTIQGEGKANGIPSLFVRTTGCNLRCLFLNPDGSSNTCDTAYSSFKPEKNKMEIDEVVDIIKANAGDVIRHVIISGGEPTMQTKELGELLKKLSKAGFHTTIETNATISSPEIIEFTNLFSMSPKLSNSNPTIERAAEHGYKLSDTLVRRHEEERINLKVIQEFIDSCYELRDVDQFSINEKEGLVVRETKYVRKQDKDFQLKFVVTKPEDIEEIKNDFLSKLSGWLPEDILLMPEGISWEEQGAKNGWVVRECIKNGFRWCPRLHVLIWSSTLRGI